MNAPSAEGTLTPSGMSLSTPTIGVQAVQLKEEDPAASSRIAEIPDAEGRKRRRITPTNLNAAPSVGPLQAGTVVESGAPDASALVQPALRDLLARWGAADHSLVEDIDEEEYYYDVSDESPGAYHDGNHQTEDENDDEEENVPPEGRALRPSKLGEDRVVDIINDCIKKYAENWRPGKDETTYKSEDVQIEVPVVYNAEELWNQAHDAGEREELAEKYELEANYYRHRLDKLCDEISKDPGDTEAAVKMKCRNLEGTVEQLERAIWLEGIYKLPPEASSDEELVSSNAKRTARSEPSDLQLSDRTHKSHLPSQVIDLGTPSASECSDDEFSKIPVIPISVEKPIMSGRVVETIPLSSDPVVLDTIETSVPTTVVPTTGIGRLQAPLGDAPEHASVATVSCWSWARLDETQDRKRVVSRAIYEMSSTDREVMRARLQKVGRTNMIREIPACVDMLLRGDQRMPGILPQDLSKILNFTKLFLCWWLCGNYFRREPSKADLEELAGCLRQRSPDPVTFCDYVATVLGTTFSLEALNRPTQPSQAEIIEISDDDDDKPPRKADVEKPGSAHVNNLIVLD